MAGDINTYSLALEMTLGAAQPMNLLKGIAKQVTDLHTSLGKEFKVAFEDKGVRQHEEAIQASAIAHKSLDGQLQRHKDTLTVLSKAVRNAGLDTEKHDEAVKKLNKAMDITQKFMTDNEAALESHGKNYEKLQKRYNDVDKVMGGQGKKIKLNRELWDQEKVAALKSADAMANQEDAIVDMLGQFGPVSSATLKNIIGLAGGLNIIPKSLKDIGIGFSDTKKEFAEGIELKASKAIKGGVAHPNLPGVGGKGVGGVSLAEKGIVNAGSSIMKSGNIAAKAAPGMASAAAGVAKVGGAATSAGMAIGGKLIPHVAIVQKALQVAKAAVGKFGDALSFIGFDVTDSGKAIIAFCHDLNILKLGLALAAAAFKEFADIQEEFRQVSYRCMGTINETTSAALDLSASHKLLGKDVVKTMKALSDSGVTMVANRKELSKMAETAGMFSTATGVSEDTTAKFSSMILKTSGDVKASERVLNMFTGAMRDFGLSATDAAAIMSNLTSKALAFKAAFGKDAVENMSAAALALTKQFTKLGAGATEVNEIMNAVNDPLSKFRAISGTIGEKDPFKVISKGMEAMTELFPDWESNMESMDKIAEAMGISRSAMAAIRQTAIETGGGIEGMMAAMKEQAAQAEKDGKIHKDFAESINTVKQEMLRILLPIMQMLSKGMLPLAEFIKGIVNLLQPAISAYSKYIDAVQKTGIAQMGMNNLLKNLEIIIQPLTFILKILMGVAMGVWKAIALGMKILAPFNSFLFMVIKSIMWVNKCLWDIGQALFEGFFSVMEEISGPIIEWLTTIAGWFDSASGAMKIGDEESSGWKKFLDIMKTVGKVIGWVVGVINLMLSPIGLIIHAVVYLIKYWNQFWDVIKGIKKSIFGSSFLHIKEGIDFIMTPLKWVLSVFEKIWNTIKKVKDIAAHPFKFVAEAAKGAVKGVLGFAEKIPVLGKAATWLKGKFHGSGFLGLDKSIALAMPLLKSFNNPLAEMGKSAKLMHDQFKPDRGLVGKLLEAYAPILKPASSAIGSIGKLLFGSGRTKSINDMSGDMEGKRESKSEALLNGLFTESVRTSTYIKVIAKLLEDGGSDEIVKLLKEHLPKISDRTPELGSAISMW